MQNFKYKNKIKCKKNPVKLIKISNRRKPRKNQEKFYTKN